MQFKKSLLFFLLLFSTLFYSQKKIHVVDAETKKPIPQVRFEFNNILFYGNDDGNVFLPIEAKEVNVFSPEYIQKNIKVSEEMELTPIYKAISEVVITKIDAKKIIESVLKDYDKNYETKTSIYSGKYKYKSKIDDEINRLLIIDMDLWTLNNKYNYKKKFDKFLQINLRNKKFDKNRFADKTYIFNAKSDRNKNVEGKENSFLPRLFLYNQLDIINFDTKNVKINGTIISQDGDIQTMNFKSDKVNIGGLISFEGTIYYNKKENTITYLKVTQNQEKTFGDYINIFNNKITSDTNSFTVAYEMYKKNEKYIPAKITMEYIANLTLENKIHPILATEEYIFNVQNFTNKNGLAAKIDLTKSFLSNVIDSSTKDSKSLLSKEEQTFVDAP